MLVAVPTPTAMPTTMPTTTNPPDVQSATPTATLPPPSSAPNQPFAAWLIQKHDPRPLFTPLSIFVLAHWLLVFGQLSQSDEDDTVSAGRKNDCLCNNYFSFSVSAGVDSVSPGSSLPGPAVNIFLWRGKRAS